MKLIFSFLMLYTTLTFARPASLDQLSLVKHCMIYDHDGFPIKPFPGNLCIFLDNGSFITASDTSLSLINKKSEVLWEIKGIYHHQLNLSSDKTRILALANDVVPNKDTKVLVDKFQVISLEGKILFEQTSSEIFKSLGLTSSFFSPTPSMQNRTGASHELSHFNSFYEVPKLSTLNSKSPIREGHLILNSVRYGTFILTPDLKKVVSHFIIPHSIRHDVHDVQITSKGTVLYFNNKAVPSKKNPQVYSNIQEIDLQNFKIVNEFKSNPESMFYSATCGGIQELDADHWLFSHVLLGTYIYSKKAKAVVSYLPQTQIVDSRSFPSQQVKAVNLKSFLSHWISPKVMK